MQGFLGRLGRLWQRPEESVRKVLTVSVLLTLSFHVDVCGQA